MITAFYNFMNKTNIINLSISTSIYAPFNLILPHQQLMNFSFSLNTLNYWHHICNYALIYYLFYGSSQYISSVISFMFIKIFVMFSIPCCSLSTSYFIYTLFYLISFMPLFLITHNSWHISSLNCSFMPSWLTPNIYYISTN